MLNYKIITLNIFLLCLVSLANAQSFYVSSSEGNDENDGLSIQSPFRTLDKLNSLVFNQGRKQNLNVKFNQLIFL